MSHDANRDAFEKELARKGVSVRHLRLPSGYADPAVNAAYMVFLAGMEHALELLQKGRQ